MSTLRWLLAGVIVGFAVSIVVLALLWFGVSGVLTFGRTDLMYVFWPSSLMLTVGWHSTVRGIVITVLSVAINCFLYMAFAYVLQQAVRKVGAH